MTIPKEAIEAAARAVEDEYAFAYGKRLGGKVAPIIAERALTAALPHIRPALSQSDDEMANYIVDNYAREYKRNEAALKINLALAAVRSDEREECAMVADRWTFHQEIAAAIRTRGA